MKVIKILVILFFIVLGACTGVVDNRTPEQRSADQTRVAEAPPPLGSIRVELLPQDDSQVEEPVVVTEEEIPTPTPCLDIKGNVSRSTGEKIYHMPGQANYENTEIEGEEESFFCTEEEAQTAGFRKAQR